MKNETAAKILVVGLVVVPGVLAVRYFLKKKHPREVKPVGTIVQKDEKETKTQAEPQTRTEIETYTELAGSYNENLKKIEDIAKKVQDETPSNDTEPAMPYSISADIWEHGRKGYKQQEVVYYSLDDTFVIADRDEVIADPNRIFGVGVKQSLREGGTTIYIRNERENMDYMITCVEGAWSEDKS